MGTKHKEMWQSMKLIDKELDIAIALIPGKVYEANLNRELLINISDIKGEILEQPAKYAWWSLVSQFAHRKLFKLESELSRIDSGDECSDQLSSKYEALKSQCVILDEAVQAFDHRGKALLKLWGKTGRKQALREYKKNLSELRALQGHCSV